MKPKRILVIEDEQIVARDLQILIRRLGHIALGPVSDGNEAIRVAAEELPDLILMDIQLDGRINGIEASRVIVEDRPVPILYITAFPGTFIANPGDMVSPFLCVAKPFSPAAVQAAIESALATSTERPN